MLRSAECGLCLKIISFMVHPYSQDLRERALNLINNGMSIKYLSHLFVRSRPTLPTAVFMLVDHSKEVACNVLTRFWL